MNGGLFFYIWGPISQKQKFSNMGRKDVLKKGKSQANPMNKSHTHIDPTPSSAKTNPSPALSGAVECASTERGFINRILIGPLQCDWHSLIFGNNGKGQIKT